MFFIVTCAAVLFAGFRVLKFKAASRQQSECSSRLRDIGQALAEYDRVRGGFPPAFISDDNGRPLYSWRAAILPFVRNVGLWNAVQFDEAWDGAKNGKLAQWWVPEYKCPSDDSRSPTTSYVAIVGPKTVWPPSGIAFRRSGKRYGALGAAMPTGRKRSEIKDTKHTILLIEIPNSNINWLEPRDVTIDQLKNGLAGLIPPGGSSPHPEGFNVLFADGHVETLPADIDPKKLIEMCNIDGSDSGSAP